MYRRNSPTKPMLGTPLDAGNATAAGLVGAWLLNEGGGRPANAASGVLAASNTIPWASGPGRGIALNNAAAGTVTVPVAIGAPLDLAGNSATFGGWALSTSTAAYQLIAGRTSGPASTNRQYGVYFSGGGTGKVYVEVGNGAFSGDIAVTPHWAANAWNHIIVTYDRVKVKVYVNGMLAGSAAATGAIPALGSAPLYLGRDGGASGFGLSGYLDSVFVWDRALSAGEVASLYARPYGMWRSRVADAMTVGALAHGIYSVAPSILPAGHAAAIPLAVHGYGLGWTPGSPGSPSLSVSGPTGTAKSSQVVTGTADATVNVATGAGAGTATISDGAGHSIAFRVVTPTLAVAPTTMIATGTASVVATGTATLWTLSSPAGLFTSSLGTVSNIAVQSDTAATFTLAAGSSQGGGTATITDTSTGATAAIAVTPGYAGSLHIVGQCTLQSSEAIFGGQAAASLSFFLAIDSNAGLNLAAGTSILRWASGTDAARYFPATGLLTLTLPGASSNLTANVPVQLGVGMHVAFSWANGAQTIYVNGVAYKTGTIGGNTKSVTGLTMGGDGGATALDHHLAHVALWGSHALSAAEALALANRASTPIQIAAPASAWWPLGGGTNGTAPALTDVGLSDFTGNGNGLAVAAGSLANAAYDALQPIAPLVTIVPQILKDGTLALFGAMCAGPAANGGIAGGCVSAVNATPTISRNGNPVALGPATWFNSTLDVPFVAYLLRCGGVANVAFLSGGEGYTSAPTATVNNAGTGGSGLTLGTPVLTSGVTSYTLTNAGAGYGQPPTVTFSGGGASVQATGHAIIFAGRLASIVIDTPGSGYTSAPDVTLAGGASGSGGAAIYTGTIAAGALRTGTGGVTVTAPGSGYKGGPTVTVNDPPNVAGPTGNTTAAALAIVGDANYSTPGAIRAIVPLPNGAITTPPGAIYSNGTGCGTGYVSAPAVAIAAPASGTAAAATAVVSQCVSNIPVTAPGSGYNSPPTITLSGGGATTQATVVPIMSGAADDDTFTYTAPAAWLTAVTYAGGNTLGGLQAVTDAPMSNWAGRMEGAVGGMNCFAQTPTMRAGGNMGSQPINTFSATYLGKNLLHRSTDGWHPAGIATGGGTITRGADGATAVSWTNPSALILQAEAYDPSWGNGLDPMEVPAWYGQFTLQYDDPGVNTADAVAAWLDAAGGQSSTSTDVTPVPQSGDASPVVLTQNQVNAAVAITSGVITAIDLSGIAFASNYTGAGILLSGGTGIGFAGTVTVSGGVPTTVNVICPGASYSKPGLVVTIYGTAVSGAQVTSVFDFQYSSGPVIWDPGVIVRWAQPRGINTFGNPWVVAPVAATRLANPSIDRTKPLALDDNIASYLTAGNGRTVGIGRFMDRTGGYGGMSNIALPSDLEDVAGNTFWATLKQRSTNVTFQYARFVNTNPSSSTYSWSSTKCYSHQAWGYQFDAPSTISGRTTAGSPVVAVTNMAASGIMAGAAVSGPGIPAGAIVAYLGASVIGSGGNASAVIKGIADTSALGLAAGMPAAGSAVPLGTTVASVDSSTQITLSAPLTAGGGVNVNVGYTSLFSLGSSAVGDLAVATATGSGVALTIQNPGYMPLPPGDNGYFASNNFGSEKSMVVELRSTSPHGIRNGDACSFQGNVRVPTANTIHASTGFDASWPLAGTLASGSAVVSGLSGATLYPAACAVFCAATTMTGTLTSGSAVVAGLPSTAGLAAGMAVAGAGVPAGATILSIQSSTQLTLSAVAAATGAQALTISIPAGNASLASGSTTATMASTAGLAAGQGVVGANVPYGATIASVNSATQVTLSVAALGGGSQSLSYSFLPSNTVIASVQSASQFTLSHASPVAGSAALIVTGFAPVAPFPFGTVWVTGPYTVVITPFVGGSFPSAASGPQVMGGTVEVPLASATYPGGWNCSTDVPGDQAASSEPFEFGASMTERLPDMALWVNIPPTASDALIGLIARRIAAHAGAAAHVYIEYGNEDWNSAFTVHLYLYGVSTLLGYAPSGTVLGHLPAPIGGQLGFIPACAAISGHASDVFTAAWTAAGRSAAKVHRVQGAWHGASSGGLANPPNNLATGDTQALLLRDMEWGEAPDHICVAPYMVMPTDWPVVQAIAQAAVPFAGGNWPMGAINDFYRFWMAYSQGQWSQIGLHGQYCANYGQPPSAAGLGQTAGGGSIPAGAYYGYYTYVDGSGGETTVGLSASKNLTLTAKNTLTIAMPVMPSWATSVNFYLSQPGAAVGAPPLSLGSVARSQYGVGHTYPIGKAVPFASLPGTRTSPPTTNLAAANSVVPTVTYYEGAIQQAIPGFLPGSHALMHDQAMHPSGRDLIWGWYAMAQQGNPTVPGSGCVAANFFQIFDPPQYPNTWVLSFGAVQPPGLGTSNAFATIQGGQPADAHDHTQFGSGGVGGGVAAQSPLLLGLTDWVGGVPGPAPAPVVTATTPASPATAAGPTDPIVVAFSEAIDPATATLTLSPTASLSGPTMSGGGTVATWRPSGAGLALATSYTATVGASSAAGDTPMVSPYSWSFVTAAAPAPTVTATVPANSAAGVAVGAAIVVTFSEAIDPATLSLGLSPTATIPSPTYNSGTRTATWGPLSLTSATSYTATVSASAAAGGTPMASPYSWSFATVGSPPTVTATTPAGSATAVAAGAAIVVTFSQAIDPATATLTLSPTASLSGPAMSGGNTVATWTPAGLALATSYTATVGASSAAGHVPMVSPYSWGFATAAAPPPTVTSTTPDAGATGVSDSVTVSVAFGEAIDPATLSLGLSPTATIPSPTYNSGARTATWGPLSLSSETSYTATASASAAAGGTPMASPYSWSFATIGSPPTVMATVPADADTAVAAGAAIVVAFSEAIDPATLSFGLSPDAPLSGPTMSGGGAVATWTPAGAGLAAATSYTATVSADSAADGLPLASPYSWSFTVAEAIPTGDIVLAEIGYQFTGPIVATDLTFTVLVSSTGAVVAGATAYDATTYLATFTPTTPFTAGVKYLVTVSGAQADDGTLMVPVTFIVTPSASKPGGNWFAGLSRQR